METPTKSKKDDQIEAIPASMASTESRPYDEVADTSSRSEPSPKSQLLMLLAPTRRRSSPDRNRTLLTAEKEEHKPPGPSNDLEKGRDSSPKKVIPPPVDNIPLSPPPGDGDEDDSSMKRKGSRKKILWCSFVFSLFIGTGAGLLGYFYMLDRNKDVTDTATSQFINPGRFTQAPNEFSSEAPSLSPTMTFRPTDIPSVSEEPTLTFMPSENPSERPTSSPTTSPSYAPTASPTKSPTTRPTKYPSSSPTESLEPTPSPTAAPTRDFVVLLEEFLLGSYGVDIDRPVDGERTSNILAIDWLEAENKRQALELNEKLVQRFALVAMDLALQGAKFAVDAPRNAQRTIDHCDWKGIKCNSDGYVQEVHWDYQQKGRNGSGTISSEAWLLVRSLKVLNLSNNGLVGKIPNSLYKLTNLEKLYLFKNQLEGTISTNIGNLNSITHFHLSHNKLSGKIPTQMKSNDSGIRPLQYFNVYSNNLTGTLPQSLRLRRCVYFDVGRNQLTGTLPNDLGEKFIWLRHLHLDHNAFTGTLPSSYNTVGNGRLESFSIDHNQLTGTIPGERSLYNKLVQYSLHSNRFQVMDSNNCKLEVPRGELVELRADCEVCICNGFFDICDLQCFRG